jgi:PKD repeat protein
MSDAGVTVPTPGPFDQYQTNSGGWNNSGGLNYFTDNGTPVGETFTTGTNTQGYLLNSLSVLFAGSAGGANLNNQNYTFSIYQISAHGTTAFPLAVFTTTNYTLTYGDWVTWNFSSPITLASNTVYAYTVKVASGSGNWAGLATVPYQSSSWYPGGSTCEIPAAGGAVTYGGGVTSGNSGYNGVFVVGLFPSGASVLVNNPTATPNPAYALSPVVLRDSAITTNYSSYTYQWLTDDGTGATPPNYITIPGATSTNLTVYPQDLNPGGADYTTNYYFVVNDTLGGSSATSSVVQLTIHAASVPLITGPTPDFVFTFAGASQSFTVTENGTVPIANLWQFDNGGGYASLTGQTNTTLTLNNLQTTDSGNYQIAATNAVGSSSSTPVALTVLAAPAAPDASEAYASAVVSNNPAAYWRFNETANNPIYYPDFAVQAYDYSGHNLNATYGYDMAIGVSGPSLPGFESTNTAVTCTANDPHAYMKAPSLNLNTNTVTICMWINPTTEAHYIGLLTWVNGADKANFGFGGNDNGSGLTELGYTWNGNSSATWGYHSGLYPPTGQWSFVALTITPTNSTLYLYYTDGTGTHLGKSTQTINNQNEAFSGGNIYIGSSENVASGGGVFDGSIDEVAVFTHSLSETDLQNLYLAGNGPADVAPTFTTQPVSSYNPFSGQQLQLTAVADGIPQPTLQWQSSAPGAGIFNDLANGGGITGVTNSTLSLSGSALSVSKDYRAVATNASGSTNSTTCAVTVTPVPTNGLWTVMFQTTNSGVSAWGNYGSGSYTGRGVIGSGNFWNPVPGAGNQTYGTYTSVSGLRDDGSTPSGINCTMIGSSIANAGAAYPANNPAGLLSQFLGVYGTVANGIVFSNVANGNYNLAFHAACGNWGDRGATFIVHGANGDQTAGTTNTSQYLYFQNNDTTVIITNVQVAGGVLRVDVEPTPVVPSHNPNGEGYYNAAEIQLVSYALPTAGFSASPTNIFVTQSVTFTDASSPVTNVLWNFGDGNTLNTTNGNVTHAYAASGTYTVSQTVSGLGGTASVTNTAYIVVAPKPTIGSTQMVAGSFVLSGTGGISGQQYRVLTSTNVALPLASWTTVVTSTFAPDGSYGYTNSTPTNAANFYILVSP